MEGRGVVFLCKIENVPRSRFCEERALLQNSMSAKIPHLERLSKLFFSEFSSWEGPLPPEIVPLLLAVESIGRRKTSILNGLSAIRQLTQGTCARDRIGLPEPFCAKF